VQEIHPYAVPAAEAAGCAEAQGKYWQMHDRLFGLRGKLARADLDEAARQAGLDAAAFRTCMDSHERWPEIERDLLDGAAAGVRGTPTFFIGGEPIEGVIPRETFERIIEQALKP
jgi:protein-disulfide isomerase